MHERRDLKAALVLRGLTQQEAARRAGISESQMSRLLNGNRAWTLLQARAFSFATGISLATILPDGDGA
jgi:transcriptional regulator with XRE-family HTH domain